MRVRLFCIAGICIFNFLHCEILDFLKILEFYKFFRFFRDGSFENGLFCCVSLLLERLKAEQMVDVFRTVKSIQMQRTLTITKLVGSSNKMGFFAKKTFKFSRENE